MSLNGSSMDCLSIEKSELSESPSFSPIGVAFCFFGFGSTGLIVLFPTPS